MVPARLVSLETHLSTHIRNKYVSRTENVFVFARLRRLTVNKRLMFIVI